MKSSPNRFAFAVRRGAVTAVRCGSVLGVAALITGVALVPAAGADDVSDANDAATGTLAAALLQTIATGSASASAEGAEQGTPPADDSQQNQGPRVTVSQSLISANGEHEITVTGAGFKDDSVVATRPPLAGKNPGVYVIFGKFADDWKPSEGAASSARTSISQFWAVNAEDVAAIGGADRGGIVMNPDGGFTTTFTVSEALVEEKAGDGAGNLGIYTYAGGGATHAAWETYQPIAFAEPETGLLGSLTGMFAIL